MLKLNFQELNELDLIKVDLVPEKKGVILKHVEYNVYSQVAILNTFTHLIYYRHKLCLLVFLWQCSIVISARFTRLMISLFLFPSSD